MLTNEMIELQRDLEASSLKVGAEKYLNDQAFKEERDGMESRDDSQKVLKGCLPLVSAELAKWRDKASAQAGRTQGGLSAIKMMDTDVMALIGLRETFHGIPKADKVSTVMVRIGRIVQTELEARAIAEKDPKAAKLFQKLVAKETSQARNEKRHEKLAERLEVSFGWDDEKRLRVGAPIFNSVLFGASEVFRTKKGGESGRDKVVSLTDDAIEWMLKDATEIAWLRPRYMPMVVPPRPWTGFSTGAYLDEALAKTVPLVRTQSGDHKRMVKQAIKDGRMDSALEAINRIQATAFRIDQRVLPWVKWAREQGLKPSKSFPLSNLPAMPTKLKKDEWEASAPEVREALSRNRKKIRDIRLASGVDSGVFASDIETAEFLAETGPYWLPCSMDFRGRVYPVPHFNFQRNDHIKGITLFDEGVPIGEEGGDWLRIHIANTGDFKNADETAKMSKCSFEERIQWTHDNERALLLVALDPAGTYDWWSSADKPFVFLQACMEFKDWWMTGFSPDFESRVSIGLDGSCSGLQHYSAMTRSRTEGALVNLVPNDRPADIYNAVVAPAKHTLELAALGGCQFAKRILEIGFGRSTVKRNVMTYFYGSGKFGMRDQHMQDTMRPLADKVALGEEKVHPYSFVVERIVKDKETKKAIGTKMEADGGFNCAQVLAAHVYQAVVNVAPMADAAATWFQNVAGILAHESHPVVWTVPTGLPVVHRYSEWESKRVKTWLYDREVHVLDANARMDQVDEEGRVLSEVRLVLRTNPTKRIDKNKARSAVSPNLVHSGDGCHLNMTGLEAGRQGITSFLFIHDEFGTHAGKTGLLAAIIRREFVNLYETWDPFEVIETYARSVLSPEGIVKLEEANKDRPVRGDLDLQDVLHAPYAFG